MHVSVSVKLYHIPLHVLDPNFVLTYCITVHRSMGNDHPCVFADVPEIPCILVIPLS